ncbi:glycosyltransferase family 2 protein [Phaeobacter sp. C3_T13_0]|uniref:glycosyltransferase family 2 protein n=1 Tax=Phaeobacter cretensis TaxID=3342641 RepID=UPI0039BD1651
MATAKNEGPSIFEWVAYHKMIGFETIIIYQNDSDDFTHEILKTLRDMGEIEYFYNRAKRGAHQVRAYKRASQRPKFRNAKRVMALDLDEFLLIKVGAGTLDDLDRALPDSNWIMLNWKQFGGAGETEISDNLVVETFQLAEHENRIVTHFAPFKSLFDPKCFARCGIHRPREALVPEETIRLSNGSGMPGSSYDHHNFRAKDPGRRALAQINHYLTKDAASFVLKSHRGSAHQANRAIDRKYWQRRNYNDQKDTLLAEKSDALRERMSALDAASGGRLQALRAQSIELRRYRFNTLLDEDAYKELYDFCVGNPGLPETVI